MAIYAGMVDNMDQNFGRLRAALEAIGEWDNTIVLFLSDNGASREGQALGTSHYFRQLYRGDDLDDDYGRLEELGGPRTFPHYPRGWAMASGTPFRLYKINTHAGGHQVPMIVSWPAGLEGGGTLRRQYVYVTDILPTLIELAGLDPPAARHGAAVKPLAGTSFASMLVDPEAPSGHKEQYSEMNGHRGFYRDGWEVVTLHLPRTAFRDDHWELYHLEADPTEMDDLAGEHPERVRELVEAWEQAAWANQVYPLNEGGLLAREQRPPTEDVFLEPVTIIPGTPTLEHYRSNAMIDRRSFAVTVRLDFRSGDEGVLVAHGDQSGGLVLYIEDGELQLLHNAFGREHLLSGGRVPAGAKEIVLDATAPGGNRYNVRLLVDGAEVGSAEGLPGFARLTPFEGIDVGIDRGSPVSWDLYERRGTFAYTGVLHSMTYTPGEAAPDSGPELLKQLREVGLRYE
jgi:arylsulfatase